MQLITPLSRNFFTFYFNEAPHLFLGAAMDKVKNSGPTL